MPFLRRAYADMMSATQGASLVVTHPSAFAARLAAETRGVRWMSAVLAPFGLMSSCDPPVFSTAPGLALLRDLTNARFDAALLAMVKKVTDPWTAPFQALRRELGLAPVINPLFEGQFSPYATLALYSKWMGELQPDHPVNCDITGFAFYDQPPRRPVSAAARPQAIPGRRAASAGVHARHRPGQRPGRFLRTQLPDRQDARPPSRVPRARRGAG